MNLSLFFIILFFHATAFTPAAAAAAPSLAKPGCQEWCGNVSIPYPFGIGQGCALSQWFLVYCDRSYSPPKPFLNSFLQIELQGEIVAVSLENQTVTTLKSIVNFCDDSAGRNSITNGTDLSGTPFYYSKSRNKFLLGGCGNALLTQNSSVLAGCTALCSGNISTGLPGCYGIDCCETPVPFDLSSYSANFTNSGIDNGRSPSGLKRCTSAFLVDRRWVPKQSTSLFLEYAPVLWIWTVRAQDLPPGSICQTSDKAVQLADGNSVSNSRCDCPPGMLGNPYLVNGCQECTGCGPDPITRKMSILPGILISAGVLVVILCIFFSYKNLKKRRANRIKAKFFKRNGGLLLQQQLSSNEDDIIDRTKLFSAKELEKATDRFSQNRILGRGGQGTVYKGMLADGRIVAVKKSVLVDESRIEEFINEVVILSRVNHRNVVKLLGCCLETEVPLLVYEFITNGTLFNLIHSDNDNDDEFPVPWDMRLKIATEVADALAYLHSSSSVPILHRDIKSSNILLDEKYRAKVSDFGTSRSIAIDQTHVTTQVKGTFGYLDPEYFQSSQFTEKSDVYSFGVVLVELMTGNKAISFATNEQERSLATRFLSAMEENRLFKILDKQVMGKDNKEDLMVVASLARRCLDLNGKKRPTMKEVVAELESVKAHTISSVGKNFEGKKMGIIEPMVLSDTNCTWTTEENCSTTSLDAHPLLLENESTLTFF